MNQELLFLNKYKVSKKISKRLSLNRYSISIDDQKILFRSHLQLPDSAVIKILETNKEYLLRKLILDNNKITLKDDEDMLEGKIVDVSKTLNKEISIVNDHIVKTTRALLNEINKTVDKISFRKSKRYLGIYNSRDNYIHYNKYLYRLPESLRFPVIAHEVSHVLVHNHSQDFYKVLLKLCPDYRKLRKKIKEYSHLIR